jgi:DNA-binding NarL/FixJ family response regulator
MMLPSATRTAVVLDRHPLWLDAVETVLTRIRVEVIAKTTVPEQALALVEAQRPDIFVAGLDTERQGMDAPTCVKRARELHSGVRAVVLAASRDSVHIDAALDAGAVAYVAKTAHPDDIAAAFRQAFEHSIYLARSSPGPSGVIAESADGAPAPELTRREREILTLVAEGYSNAELARMLWVTRQTIKFHLSNIYRKLGVANRTEASHWARANGQVGEVQAHLGAAHPPHRSMRRPSEPRRPRLPGPT